MSKEVKRWKRKQLELMRPEHEVVDAKAYDALLAERDALQGALDRQVPLHEALQRAAGELPKGWEIRLCVEHHAGWVELIGPDGTEDFATNDERLDYTVIDALEHALQGEQP
ncbi:MAG TPA: hypothetical protein DCR78_08930 [Pseudomonas sp.]|jgi:hypothetical protein|nr:hypothetical protein [Pseudomonas sp.]|tara:strand:+ start:1044 stop:1379 length:336 start_codon:yes stop_codon:yes gene_type:complete